MDDFYDILNKARNITKYYNGIKLNLNEEENIEEPRNGTAIDKKTEIEFFINSMKANGIYTNMKFNDVKIYSDYVEFSGEVPIQNNTIFWLTQKDCTIRFANPLIFGSIQKNQTSSLSYDVEDVFEVISEINNTIKGITEYYEKLKLRLPDYLSKNVL